MMKISLFCLAVIFFAYEFNSFAQENCISCTQNEQTPHATTIRTIHEGMTISNPLKSKEECLHYMECYAGNNNCEYYDKSKKLHRYDCIEDFKNKYSTMVDHASKVCSIPSTALSCFYFRESKWDSNDKSYAGAMGIAQIMPALKTTLNRYISNKPGFTPNNYTIDNLKSFKAITSDNEYIDGLYDKVINNIGDSVTKKETMIAQENLEEYYFNLNQLYNVVKKTGKMTAEMKSAFSLWFTQISIETQAFKASEQWKAYFKKLGKTPPTSFDPNNAEHAIIGGAIAIDTIMEPEVRPSKGWSDPIDKYAFIAGAYNFGQNGFPSKCDTNKVTIEQCIQKFPKGDQTRNYMISLQRCMDRGNWKGMTGDEHLPCEPYSTLEAKGVTE